MEWIIYDDGTDKIEDLVKDVKNVKILKQITNYLLVQKETFYI